MQNLKLLAERITPVGEITYKCIKDGNEVPGIADQTACDTAKGAWTAVSAEKESDLNGIIIGVINAILGVVGLIAVVMIILGGISYMTSAGDSAKVKKGKDTILYGIIGLVIVGLAFAIVNFVIKNIIK